MKSRKLGLLFVLVMGLISVGNARAQAVGSERRPYRESISAALAVGNYLDAYSAVFMLNDSAPSELVEALMSEPETEADQQTQVFLLLFAGLPDKALTEAEGLPESSFSLVIQVAANDILGNVEAADHAFALALEGAPDEAQLYVLRAAAAFVKGEPDKILENSSHAIELNPKLAAAYRLRGIAKLYTGDPEAALADADSAIKLDPSVYFFHYLRGNAHFALGDPEAALADVDAALALNPSSFIGHVMRSKANVALNNGQQAAQDFASAVEARTNEVVSGDSLVPGEPVQMTMTFGRTFRLPFEVQAGQTLSAHVAGVHPGEVDPLVLVLSPEGVPLVFNDDASDDTLDAEINGYTLLDSGTYTLVVSHANGGSEGKIEALLSLI